MENIGNIASGGSINANSAKNDKKQAIKLLKSLVLGTKTDINVFRDAIFKNFYTPSLPDRVIYRQQDFLGVVCDILTPPLICQDKTIVYVHGGSFVAGNNGVYRNFCASLSNISLCRTVIPNFSLAPEKPFPQGVNDIKAVLQQLVDFLPFGQEAKLILVADGSGASVLLSSLLDIKEEYKKHFLAVVLLSPWLDLTLGHLSAKEKKHPLHAPDKVLCACNITRAASLYTYTSNLSNPAVSVLLNPSRVFQGLPPFYIQVAKKELLLDQSFILQDLLHGADVECTVEAFPDMMFSFQLADRFLWESFAAIEKLGKYIAQRP